MARKLEVIITGDTAALEKAFGRANTSASGFQKTLKAASIGATVALAGMALAAKAGFSEFMEGERVSAQTAAAIKSTGAAANATQGQIEKLAGNLSDLSGVDDEVIQSGENMLLTFTKIRNEVGEGNDIFDKATKASLNLSVAMGKDMASSALLVGKALNDPIKGMGALSRAGVQFTNEQKDTIKAMVATGNTMGAQKLILKELETQFGGSAKAAGDTFSGGLNKAKNSLSEMAASIVGAAVPALASLSGSVQKGAAFLQEHQKATQIAVIAVAALSVGVLAVNAAMKVYSAGLVVARAAQLAFNAALALNPIGLVIIALVALGVALVVAYQKSETFRTIVNAAFNSVKTVVGGVIDFIGDHWKAMLSLLAGPAVLAIGQISKAWQGLQTVVATVISAILGAIDKFLGGLSAIARAASHLPFVGDKFKGIANAIDNTRESVRRLQAEIDGMRGKTIEIRVNTVHHELSVDDREGGRGGRAAGGPVTAGGRYLVGEKGPELFVPNRSGTIIPNGGVPRAAMAGAGGGNTYNIYASTTYGDDQSVQRLVGKIRQELRRGTARNG